MERTIVPRDAQNVQHKNYEIIMFPETDELSNIISDTIKVVFKRRLVDRVLRLWTEMAGLPRPKPGIVCPIDHCSERGRALPRIDTDAEPLRHVQSRSRSGRALPQLYVGLWYGGQAIPRKPHHSSGERTNRGRLLGEARRIKPLRHASILRSWSSPRGSGTGRHRQTFRWCRPGSR